MTSIVRILKYVPKVNNLIINDRYIVKKTTFDNYKLIKLVVEEINK